MKGREFLSLPSSVARIGTVASLSDGNAAETRKEVIVNAGDDRDGDPIKFLGATFDVKVSGKDTEGRCVIFDTTRRGKVGPALHLNTDCEEWFFVRDEEFKFQVGEQTLLLKSGDSLMVARETPHAFVKTSEGDARLIVMASTRVENGGILPHRQQTAGPVTGDAKTSRGTVRHAFPRSSSDCRLSYLPIVKAPLERMSREEAPTSTVYLPG
ncbi:MAG TPA: cupin domain-containing protein [Bryobacteraceae bacterium]|nr:cupin domain-containing protein [Bryobacteraceae bacterium]